MELHPGLFVSKADTNEWEADPEVPGSDVQVLVDADGVQAGSSRFLEAGAPVPWTSSAREVFVILIREDRDRGRPRLGARRGRHGLLA